jgi:predicted nucleic acid-binding protein
VSWLLDSDVLSQPAKKVGDARVITWLEKHQDRCYISSIVIAHNLTIAAGNVRDFQRPGIKVFDPFTGGEG